MSTPSEPAAKPIARFGSLNVSTRGPDGNEAHARVFVNGVSRGESPCVVELDPGEHAVEVRSWHGNKSKSLIVKSGSSTEATFTFAGADIPIVSPDAATSPRLVNTESAAESSGSFMPWVTLGTGVALAIGGGATALAAQLDKNEIEDAGLGLSQVQARADWDDADTQATIGLSLLGVGAAVAVGGLFWELNADGEAPSAAIVTPASGGLSVGFAGTF